MAEQSSQPVMVILFIISLWCCLPCFMPKACRRRQTCCVQLLNRIGCGGAFPICRQARQRFRQRVGERGESPQPGAGKFAGGALGYGEGVRRRARAYAPTRVTDTLKKDEMQLQTDRTNSISLKMTIQLCTISTDICGRKERNETFFTGGTARYHNTSPTLINYTNMNKRRFYSKLLLALLLLAAGQMRMASSDHPG